MRFRSRKQDSFQTWRCSTLPVPGEMKMKAAVKYNFTTIQFSQTPSPYPEDAKRCPHCWWRSSYANMGGIIAISAERLIVDSSWEAQP